MSNERHYYFYVLYCQDNTLYAGFTTNIEKRVATHNAGKGAKYTQLAKRRPVCAIYAEHCCTKSHALRQEAAFKKLTRVAKERYLQANGVEVARLCSRQMPLPMVMIERNECDE